MDILADPIEQEVTVDGAAIRAGFNDDRTATRCGAGLIVGRKGIGTLFAQ